MTEILALSGFAQASDSLRNIMPADTIHLNYSNYANIDHVFKHLGEHNPKIVAGWSLGGQIALRAISEAVIAPEILVLIAAPYQFVVSKDIKCAMDKDSFHEFYVNFTKDPAKTSKRFITLIAMNDNKMHEIMTKLRHEEHDFTNPNWLYWLKELEEFSGNYIDYTKIPKTYGIYGRDDTLVDLAQASLYKTLIKDFELKIFNNCGHAPHLHDEIETASIIKKICQNLKN